MFFFSDLYFALNKKKVLNCFQLEQWPFSSKVCVFNNLLGVEEMILEGASQMLKKNFL